MKYLLPTAAAGLLLLAAQPAMAQVKLLEQRAEAVVSTQSTRDPLVVAVALHSFVNIKANRLTCLNLLSMLAAACLLYTSPSPR
ncbi:MULTISPECIES: hypothetical protein, partial [Bacteria]|uniref:hypothetical protein n=1 Tax=Bacteria TaxID=2 RepID=UPI001E3CFEF1